MLAMRRNRTIEIIEIQLEYQFMFMYVYVYINCLYSYNSYSLEVERPFKLYISVLDVLGVGLEASFCLRPGPCRELFSNLLMDTLEAVLALSYL